MAKEGEQTERDTVEADIESTEVTEDMQKQWDGIVGSDDDDTADGVQDSVESTGDSAATSEEEGSQKTGDSDAPAVESDIFDEDADRLVEAGRRAKLSDEVIADLKEKNPEVLEALAQSQPTGDEESSGDEETGSEESVVEAIVEKAREGGHDEDFVRELVAPLYEQIEALTGQIGEIAEGHAETSQVQTRAELDAFFDSRAEENPELGDSKKSLSREAIGVRKRISTLAQAIQNGWNDPGMGLSERLDNEKAMTLAFNAYSGRQAERKATNKLITELNRGKKRMTLTPSRRNTGDTGEETDSAQRTENTAVQAAAEYLETAGITVD